MIATSTAPPVSATTLVTARWWTPGIPAPKGSARAIVRGGRPILVASSSDANKAAQASWSAAVGWAAKATLVGHRPIDGAVQIAIAFYLPRPKSVTRARPTTKPDIDKLTRSTLDALTGIVWVDDAQVVSVTATKDYAGTEGPGAWIEAWRVTEPTTTAGDGPARSKQR